MLQCFQFSVISGIQIGPRNICGSTKYLSDVVALILARDRDKSSGIYFCAYLCGTLCFLVCPT